MTTRSEFATTPIRLPLDALSRALAFLFRGYDRHLQRLDLSQLTDEQLDDIGLSRREATREAAKPFWR
jgi:uncharacterized protein YjiS (DUF1127 family)